MARLFITPREIDFISDLTKEINKDVIGQKVFYYKIRPDLTDIHEIYEEAMTKVFNPPVEVEARVDWDPSEIKTTRFGTETVKTIQVYIHYRDLLDRNLEIQEGDYISYGNIFFEITSSIFTSLIFGQVEYKTGLKLACKQARKGQIDFKVHGPTDEGDTTPDAVQKTFVQQRGSAINNEGETGDKRALIEQGKVTPVEDGPAEVSERGDSAKISSSFYGDDYDV
ncbi:MAG: hypothetical protein CMB77_04195 [Euryarchaeota archaeon]|nr:hypothetical protein [Euryarchaeota archaeon]|tara:strand:+ start:41392 stop:42066 length:675 start_codon:yes stop_codon:yes gene_type:complete